MRRYHQVVQCAFENEWFTNSAVHIQYRGLLHSSQIQEPSCPSQRVCNSIQLMNRGVPRDVGSCASDDCGNDPSAGSPTETLLRLHLPLNGKVYSTFRRAHACCQSEDFTGPFNR